MEQFIAKFQGLLVLLLLQSIAIGVCLVKMWANGVFLEKEVARMKEEHTRDIAALKSDHRGEMDSQREELKQEKAMRAQQQAEIQQIHITLTRIESQTQAHARDIVMAVNDIRGLIEAQIRRGASG